MALKRYKAEADNTIVNAYERNLRTRGTGSNAGAADILETFSIYGRVTTSSQELSRILIQFPITDVSTDRTNSVLPASGNVSFYLRLFNAPTSKTVPRDYTLTVLAVSQSWQEGVGLDLENYQDLTLGNQGSNWMSGSNADSAAATATIKFNSDTAGDYDDETFTVTSTDGTTVVYTLNDDSTSNTYGASTTSIGIQGAPAASKVAELATAAGNNSSNAHADKITFVEGASATVTLTQDVSGFAGNKTVATSDSTDITVSGFTGGESSYWTDINNTLLAGGSYITGGAVAGIVDTEIFTFTKNFSTGLEDLELDITPLVEQWIAGTYPNYGVGVHLSASYEAYDSGSANSVTSRIPGQLALDSEDSTQSVIYNPSGSTTSYYTKRFFARGTEYFFKRPALEARWDSATRDDRGNFFFSSSLAPAAKNLNTIYFYNYIDGQLTDIPAAHAGTFEKRIYVSIYSGSTGGFYTGGDGEDVPPSDIPVSGATSANTGSVQFLSADDAGHVRAAYPTVITGGIVSTGIYSASFAFTGTANPPLRTIYDVWFTGSEKTTNANDALVQYFTGTIPCHTLRAQNTATRPSYYMSITNLKGKYRADEMARFNLYVRNRNWDPTVFTKANVNAPMTNIASASYKVYRTLDAYDAVPYGTGSDKHTVLSYDVSGNYFDFDMKLLEPGYSYAFKFAFYDNAVSSWVEQPDTFKFRVEDYEY